MKKIYSLILMCMFTLMANAEGTAQVDGLKYNLAADQTAVVSGSVSKSGNVVIPNTITYEGTTYNVIGIAEEAFTGNNISSVKIAASVKNIGTGAFESCSSLGSVTFEEGSKLESIVGSVFATCPNLSEVTFAKDGALNYIGNSAFTGCTALKEINFPASLRTIDFYAFGECTSLKEFTFDANAQLTNIEPFAFNSCSSLAVANLPASLTSIGDMAFTSCKNLAIVRSLITEPFNIGDAFDFTSGQTLYVPVGTKAKYQAAKGWKNFKNIEEDASAIEGINAEMKADGAIYDLQGRRIESPVKGSVYIRNGKKVMF